MRNWKFMGLLLLVKLIFSEHLLNTNLLNRIQAPVLDSGNTAMEKS